MGPIHVVTTPKEIRLETKKGHLEAALLRSTFTQLMFLDGRYAQSFRKFDERRGYRGERVVTWAVDWP